MNVMTNTLSDFVADVVDPNRDGYVSLQEYMAFMISKETENVQSSEEIENAFRAITAGDRPYVTKEELYAVSICYLPFSSIYNIFILFTRIRLMTVSNIMRVLAITV